MATPQPTNEKIESDINATLVAYRIPHHLRPGLIQYVIYGTRPGSFISAIAANDLVDTLDHAASEMSLENIHDLVKWFYGESPAKCHGSRAKIETYIREMENKGHA